MINLDKETKVNLEPKEIRYELRRDKQPRRKTSITTIKIWKKRRRQLRHMKRCETLKEEIVTSIKVK